MENIDKLVANLHNISEYLIPIKNLKQVLKHEFILKYLHGVIKFNKKHWLKPYIDINT